MRSSYIENHYDIVFRSLIIAKRPGLVVECGVLDGYSLSAMAEGVKFNHEKFGVLGKIESYDLYNNYRFKHGDWHEVDKMLDMKGLSNYVLLAMGDAFEVHRQYDDGSIDFLHMDISNNGDTLLKTLELWGDKISPDGMIAFEGGSEQRDNVEWMKTFEFKPIREALNDKFVELNWEYHVLDPFPSLTLLWHKVQL